MIPLREQEYISDRFARELEGKVKIDYFTQKPSPLYVPGREECATCEDTRALLEELAALSDKVTLTVHEFGDAQDEAQKLGVDKVPGIVLRGPANRALRFFGMPGGNEFPNFIETMIDVSKQKTDVGAEAAKQLKKLKDDVSITVYVTPTCPHCPGVVRAAYRLALASPRVHAAAVEISEFPRLAQQLGVRAVPLTVINDEAAVAGAVDETALLEYALKAAERGGLGGTAATGGATSAASTPSPGQQTGGLIVPR
ncbi:MAG: thioredoxin family protein [Dehalococcoidia bacterium]|nr:thioredoxin family protein [Dehalococcoidia bacterium]MDZ4278672.1 thioredoxin family protein [Dehalococcoidia bacterium]